MRILLRNQKAAITIATIILIGTQAAAVGPVVGLIAACVAPFLVMRFGLLAATFYTFSLNLIMGAPMTLQASAWYYGYGYLALAIFAAIVLYAFYTSLGGRPLFGTPRLDD